MLKVHLELRASVDDADLESDPGRAPLFRTTRDAFIVGPEDDSLPSKEVLRDAITKQAALLVDQLLNLRTTSHSHRNVFDVAMRDAGVPAEALTFVRMFPCPACHQPLLGCDNGAHYIPEALHFWRYRRVR